MKEDLVKLQLEGRSSIRRKTDHPGIQNYQLDSDLNQIRGLDDEVQQQKQTQKNLLKSMGPPSSSLAFSSKGGLDLSEAYNRYFHGIVTLKKNPDGKFSELTRYLYRSPLFYLGCKVRNPFNIY